MRKQRISNRNRVLIILLMVVITGASFLSACGSVKAKGSVDGVEMSDLSKFEASDMSGYEGLSDYKAKSDLPFVDVTVRDVHELIEAKGTFVLFVSFANCPWCNAIIKQFLEVVDEVGSEDLKIAQLNTRKNPAWQNNMEIDDYDLFVEDFGDYLELDENNIKHLYVPHVFFVKDGAVVYEHQGAIPAMGSDPYMELSKAQKEELRNVYREGFKALAPAE